MTLRQPPLPFVLALDAASVAALAIVACRTRPATGTRILAGAGAVTWACAAGLIVLARRPDIRSVAARLTWVSGMTHSSVNLLVAGVTRDRVTRRLGLASAVAGAVYTASYVTSLSGSGEFA